jgi:hypothetical protein
MYNKLRQEERLKFVREFCAFHAASSIPLDNILRRKNIEETTEIKKTLHRDPFRISKRICWLVIIFNKMVFLVCAYN